ncbi:hypothetical protein ARMGADRAFT_1028352 [Armillaria gallica]|uniref:Uncharacterized protein n=1 Tax=Armillaria gallica TaxID=47427 RepID=A0A2H3DQ16_ARMGA|nr:hypothetical protein ARMGADRAFT_1028352 [Armillaria gallica]
METSLPTHCRHLKSSRVIFERLDRGLNSIILEALLHGLYTGIIAITLWTMLIVTLYVLRTATFAMDLAFKHRAFIEHGHDHCNVYTALLDHGTWGRANYLVSQITGGISILLVDATIIWRCWVVWVYRWRIVFLPLFHKSIKTRVLAAQIPSQLIYLLLTLTTTIMCTVLIVYRIARFAHRLIFFRSIISALIESSAIDTLSLMVYLVVQRGDGMAADYADIIFPYAREIAPILLILRVAAISNSSSGDKESNVSVNISDIHFRPMGESTSSDNHSEQRFSGSRGIHTAETV